MKTTAFTFLFTASFGVLLAQGPGVAPPGGPHPGGFGPFGGRGLAIAGMGPGELVTGAPYSATQVVQSQTAFADGNRISNRHQTQIYRDSQGRIRTLTQEHSISCELLEKFATVSGLPHMDGKSR